MIILGVVIEALIISVGVFSTMALSAPIRFPLTFQKLVCTRLSPKFREAVELRSAQLTAGDVTARDVVVRNRYVGINASDINFTAGTSLTCLPCITGIMYSQSSKSLFLYTCLQ